MLKKIAFVSLVVSCLSLHTEYLLYRVDATQKNKIGTLSYDKLPADEQEKLWKLYESTVYRYQWPTVIRFFNPSKFSAQFKLNSTIQVDPLKDLIALDSQKFSSNEATEYLRALEKKPHGLFDFIKSKVEAKSNKQYSLLWVPTTIFELAMLVQLDYAVIYAKGNRIKLRNPDIKSTFQKYCHAVDKIISENQFSNFGFDSKTYVKDLLGSYISKELEQEDQRESFLAKLASRTQYSQINETRQQEMLLTVSPIIQKYIEYELLAFKENQSVFVRGTYGFKSDATARLEAFDYEFGSSSLYAGRSFSYGYSLFAGTLFDETAQALTFILKRSNIGYVLLIDMKDYFTHPYTVSYVFALPTLSTIQGLFGYGENFHPRTNQLNEVPQLELGNMELGLADYLSKAKLISKSYVDPKQSETILQHDIKAQEMTLINEAVQRLSYIKSEEKLEREKILQEHKKKLEQLKQETPKEIS